jgi:outer membrane protein assembly factor BamB
VTLALPRARAGGFRCARGPALAALLALAPQEDWPSFRGAGARGVAEGHALATSFDVPKGENVLWRTPIAGMAHSSPVVSRELVFVSSAVRKAGPTELKIGLYGDPEAVGDEGEHDFVVLALDKQTGKIAWQSTAWNGTPKYSRHPKSSYAASTPATDGERLVVNFGTEGLYCFDRAGKQLWKRDLGDVNPGPYNMEGVHWGYASSPAIHAGKVYVQCDGIASAFLAAFDLATGNELWRVKRDEISTWATPTVDVRDGRSQVICNGYKHIGGYDLATGKELWKLVGGGDAPVPAPVVIGDMVLITNAHGRLRPIYAISAMAEGLISPEHEAMLWCHLNAGNYMQTPLVYGEELYLQNDTGVLTCMDLATGEQHYRERVGDGQTGFTASMVAGDGKLYSTSEEGTVHVLAPGPSFEVLSKSDLGENCMASPAISGGVLFWRTQGHLVAIRAPK